MKLPVLHIRAIRFSRKAINIDCRTTWHQCGVFVWANLVACLLLLLAMVLSLTPLSQQTISLSTNFHLRFSEGRIWFFNNARYGPYRGSIISVSGGTAGSWPLNPVATKWWDSWGIYYRHFRWPTDTLWTLAVTLWYFIGLTSIVPLVWWVRRYAECLPEGLCSRCGYDLRAHKPGGKCPECGLPIPQPNCPS